MKFFVSLLCLWIGTAGLHARDWTSADGRKLEADYQSATFTKVTLKRTSNGESLTIPLSRLSPEDQAWVRAQIEREDSAPPSQPLTGPFAHMMTGQWELESYAWDQIHPHEYAVYGAKNLDAAKLYPLVVAWEEGKAVYNPEKDRYEILNGVQLVPWVKTFVEPSHYHEHPCIVVAPVCLGSPAAPMLKLIKEMMASLPIDPKRVYTVGYQGGGGKACDLIREGPDIFAGGVAACGVNWPGRDGDPMNLGFTKVPLWIGMAGDAPLKPWMKDKYWIDHQSHFIKAIKRLKHCKVTEVPVGGPDYGLKFFSDPETHEWLFSKSRK